MKMKVTLIGCGNMGKGLAQRLSHYNSFFLYDYHQEKAEQLQQEGYGVVCAKLQEVLPQSDVVIIAIKPQNLKELIPVLSAGEPFNATFISLLAGTTLSELKDYFPTHRILRMMPNLAVIYGEGVIGLATNDPLTEQDRNRFTELCTPLGKVYWLSEAKINALTALAGSGPAFVFAMIEAMVDAGIGMGFSSQEAEELVYHMIKGSLHLLQQSGKHPGELKWQVASPGGTTIAGIHKLEELALRGSIIQTFLAAYQRSIELSLKRG